MNVLANRLDAHLKTALLAYFDNEFSARYSTGMEDVSGRLGLLTMLFLISLSLFCLRYMFGIRKSNENYRCETDVIYFRQQEMGQSRVTTLTETSLDKSFPATLLN